MSRLLARFAAHGLLEEVEAIARAHGAAVVELVVMPSAGRAELWNWLRAKGWSARNIERVFGVPEPAMPIGREEVTHAPRRTKPAAVGVDGGVHNFTRPRGAPPQDGQRTAPSQRPAHAPTARRASPRGTTSTGEVSPGPRATSLADRVVGESAAFSGGARAPLAAQGANGVGHAPPAPRARECPPGPLASSPPTVDRRVSRGDLLEALVKRTALEQAGQARPTMVLCDYCSAPVLVRKSGPIPRYCRPQDAPCRQDAIAESMRRAANASPLRLVKPADAGVRTYSAPVVPLFSLVRGAGERRDCRRYADCLDAYVRAAPRSGCLGESPAHCPPNCSGFSPIPRHAELELASTGGETWLDKARAR